MTCLRSLIGNSGCCGDGWRLTYCSIYSSPYYTRQMLGGVQCYVEAERVRPLPGPRGVFSELSLRLCCAAAWSHPSDKHTRMSARTCTLDPLPYPLSFCTHTGTHARTHTHTHTHTSHLTPCTLHLAPHTSHTHGNQHHVICCKCVAVLAFFNLCAR